MAGWFKSQRFLDRLSAPLLQSERHSQERVIGTARAVVSLLSLIAIYIDPTDPERYIRITSSLAFLWVAYSVGIVLWLRDRTVGPKAVWVIHVLDLAWPLAMMFFSLGPNSPFFAYLVFALVAASFRWGFAETLATAVLGLCLMDVQAYLLVGGPLWAQHVLEGGFDVNRLIIRGAYLLVLGVLVGYLGEMEKERRAETVLFNRTLTNIRADIGLAASMQNVANEFLRVYNASSACVVISNVTEERTFVWQFSMAKDSRPSLRELGRGESDAFLLNDEPRTFVFSEVDGKTRYEWLCGNELIVEPGRKLHDLPCGKPHPTSVVSTSHDLASDWSGRILLFDAQLGSDKLRELRFSENLLKRAAPALYNVFLIRRLRARAGALERARVARELHDGAIQSLISIEMQIDVARRKSERGLLVAQELEHIQGLVQEEVLNLRELMQQMRPVDVVPAQFLDVLADIVERFRRDTGIEATFSSDLQDVEIAPRSCRELARVLQEGLVNVRKHSRARNVLVRFSREDGVLKLILDDDGCGFDFTGRMDMKQLNALRKGPTIIKERVRSIGGNLTISSSPGQGARLEIALPQKGHASHG